MLCLTVLASAAAQPMPGFDCAKSVTALNRLICSDQDLIEHRVLAEARIDRLFQAAAEATQEAVLDALAAAAETTVGRQGHRRVGLAEVLGQRGD